MLTHKQRPAVQTKVKLLQRRPSRAFLSALNLREKAEQLRGDVETSPLFMELLERGIIRKARLRGLIPQDEYLSYRLKEAVAFINRYALESQPEWSQIFKNARTEEYVDRLAQEWKVPKGELRRLLRLLTVQHGEGRSSRHTIPLSEKKIHESTSSLDPGNDAEIIASFVSRHNLTQQDFITYVLSGSSDARELSARFGCQAEEAEVVQKSISHLEILEVFREEVIASSGRPTLYAPRNVIAEVCITSDGCSQIRFLDKQASSLYLINYGQLEQWAASSVERDSLRALLQAVRALNERSGTLANIVQTICSIQADFIASGDPLHLAPVSQAELARRVGYHRSVVSRLIRGQHLLISNRVCVITELMPRTREVVARLLTAHREWTDAQITKHLAERFGVRISQRAVNHHRHALTRTRRRDAGPWVGGLADDQDLDC